MTWTLLLPKCGGVRGERVGVHAPLRVPRTDPPRGAPSSSSRADVVRTSSRTSSASQRRRASACTNRDIRNSGDAAALAWASFIDGRRDRPPPRIFRPDRGYAAAVRLREWISKPPRGGSRSGRRQSLSSRALTRGSGKQPIDDAFLLPAPERRFDARRAIPAELQPAPHALEPLWEVLEFAALTKLERVFRTTA